MIGERVNLLGLARAELEAFVADRLGAKPFRARQLMKWIYRRRAADFSAMSDLAQDFRAQLADVAKIAVPEIVTQQISSDGTRKWMLRMDEVQGIETVYIPEPGRGTLCISSQVGCAMDCTFCATAQQGFNRNLSVAEIVGQVWLAHRELTETRADGRTITNIVFMGMGEPLANYRNVVPAMRIFLDDLGYDLSRRRVTLSTSGLVPQIYKLAEECNVALAVSLHAPNDALRNELVPINRKHPIAELLAGLRYRVEVRQSPETGDLPLVTVSAPFSTMRPPDSLVTVASGLAGGTSFSEVLDLATVQSLKDPLREQIAAILRSHGQEL